MSADGSATRRASTGSAEPGASFISRTSIRLLRAADLVDRPLATPIRIACSDPRNQSSCGPSARHSAALASGDERDLRAASRGLFLPLPAAEIARVQNWRRGNLLRAADRGDHCHLRRMPRAQPTGLRRLAATGRQWPGSWRHPSPRAVRVRTLRPIDPASYRAGGGD